MAELSNEQQTAIRRIQALFQLAAKNPNEHESLAAAAKAQAMLEQYNLDMATVDANSGDNRREDAKMRGGLYHFQRELWEAVAQLNFCLYWNQYVWDQDKTGRRRYRSGGTYKYKGGYRFVHRVVGRKVNVVATQVMAQYLEQTIERLTRERLRGDGTQFFTRWAISYREGMADRIILKVYDRRQQVMSAERRKAREAAAKATAGASTSTALTLADVAKSEYDANVDFIYGEGTSARWAADRAEAAAERQRREQEYSEWAKANPELAKKAEEEERKAARRRGAGPKSYADRRRDKIDWGAYKSGEEQGQDVSIDQQADRTRTAGVLG